jgi:hypothetical protein
MVDDRRNTLFRPFPSLLIEVLQPKNLLRAQALRKHVGITSEPEGPQPNKLTTPKRLLKIVINKLTWLGVSVAER